MPPASTWAFVFSDGPIDAQRPETPVHIATADPTRQINAYVPTKTYEGITGHRFQFFGRLLDPHVEVDPDGPRWQLDLDGTPQINLEIWDMYVYKPKSPFRVQRTWRPGEGERANVECLSDEWDDADHRATAVALRWLRDFKTIVKHAGGRPKTPKEKKVDALAKAGLKWLRAHEYSKVEDVGRPELDEATGDRGLPALHKHMGRAPKVVNADVHQRMHELLAEQESAR
jgi:hypothetical protein